MFPWEVHNGWSPSLVQLISVISAIGWAPASLNPLSLLHLPPPPPPPTFFSFSRASFPRVNDRFCAPVSQRAAPLNPSLDGSSTVSRWKWKRRKEKKLNFPNQVRPSFSKSFRSISLSPFPGGSSLLFSFFFFYGKSNLYDRKERRWNPFYSLVKYRNTVVYLLWIYFLRVFCTSIISIPHNVLHKYSRSGDSER